LITQFQTLSDADYKNISIPHLEFINSEEFLKHNIVLKQKEAEIAKTKEFKNVTIAKYLPSLNFTAGYTWAKSAGQGFETGGKFINTSNELSYYNYGFQVSMPLDYNTLRDIESAKVDYLKSQVVSEDKRRELHALFEQVMHNIQNYDKKISLSNENIKLYSKLLKDTKDLYKAGYKTQYDVETLQNSLKIQNIDSKLFELDKQLALLTLYEMYVNRGK